MDAKKMKKDLARYKSRKKHTATAVELSEEERREFHQLWEEDPLGKGFSHLTSVEQEKLLIENIKELRKCSTAEAAIALHELLNR